MEVSEGLISKIHTSFAGGIHFASPVSSLRTTEFELVSALISCRKIIIEFLPRITKYVLSLRNDYFFSLYIFVPFGFDLGTRSFTDLSRLIEFFALLGPSWAMLSC